MGDDSRRELEIDERDVGRLRQDAAPAGRGDMRRRLVEPVAQDREVVRPEIPRDAHVGLVEPEVDAARGDEVDLSQVAVLDQRADHVHRRAVDERVARHQHHLPERGQLDQHLGLLGGGRERLLDEHVLAVAQRRRGDRKMGRDRRGDQHGVDGRVLEEVVEPLRAAHRRIPLRDLVQRLRAPVADPGHLGILDLVQVPHEVRPPVAEPDHAEPEPRHAVPPGRSSCTGVRSSNRRSSSSDQPRA